MNGPLAQLAFLCLFNLIGGIALGAALRGLKNGFSGNTLFFLIWGGMFGCFPLAAGLQEFNTTGRFGFLAVQLGVLAVAILVAALTPNSILDSLRSPQVSPIAGGGLFLLVGIGIGVLVWQTEPLLALGFGGCFAGAGALLFLSGLTKLLKS